MGTVSLSASDLLARTLADALAYATAAKAKDLPAGAVESAPIVRVYPARGAVDVVWRDAADVVVGIWREPAAPAIVDMAARLLAGQVAHLAPRVRALLGATQGAAEVVVVVDPANDMVAGVLQPAEALAEAGVECVPLFVLRRPPQVH